MFVTWRLHVHAKNIGMLGLQSGSPDEVAKAHIAAFLATNGIGRCELALASMDGHSIVVATLGVDRSAFALRALEDRAMTYLQARMPRELEAMGGISIYWRHDSKRTQSTVLAPPVDLASVIINLTAAAKRDREAVERRRVGSFLDK